MTRESNFAARRLQSPTFCLHRQRRTSPGPEAPRAPEGYQRAVTGALDVAALLRPEVRLCVERVADQRPPSHPPFSECSARRPDPVGTQGKPAWGWNLSKQATLKKNKFPSPPCARACPACLLTPGVLSMYPAGECSDSPVSDLCLPRCLLELKITSGLRPWPSGSRCTRLRMRSLPRQCCRRCGGRCLRLR